MRVECERNDTHILPRSHSLLVVSIVARLAGAGTPSPRPTLLLACFRHVSRSVTYIVLATTMHTPTASHSPKQGGRCGQRGHQRVSWCGGDCWLHCEHKRECASCTGRLGCEGGVNCMIKSSVTSVTRLITAAPAAATATATNELHVFDPKHARK